MLCRCPTHPATAAPGVHEYPRATSPPAHADCKNSFRRPGAPWTVARPIRHRIGPAIGAPGAGGRSARGRGRAPGRRRPTTETVASRCIVLSRRRAVQAWHGRIEPDCPINAKLHPHVHAVLRGCRRRRRCRSVATFGCAFNPTARTPACPSAAVRQVLDRAGGCARSEGQANSVRASATRSLMSMLPLAPLSEAVCQDWTATARGPTSPSQKPNTGPPD